MEDNILRPTSPEDAVERSLRPKTLEDFQGQQRLKKNLSIFIQAAREREECLDHLFLSGPPGLGKTTLAHVIASEMETSIRMTSAPALDKPKDLAGILTTLENDSILFIDEIHRLKPIIEEMLYIAMEDFELDWIIGQGPGARAIRIPLPPFTIVGATTRAGKISGPLHSRFGIVMRIGFYQQKELASIIARSAALLEIEVAESAVEKIARCARGTPRIANRLLRRIRDFAQVFSGGIINDEIVDKGMAQLGIDEYGLEQMDRRILKTIVESYRGGPVGGETLAISVGESVETLEDFYEPYLIQQGLLERSPRGRRASFRAYEYLGYPAPPTDTPQTPSSPDDAQSALF